MIWLKMLFIWEYRSAIAIKNHMKGTNSSFSFQTVTKENIAKLLMNLDIKKAVQSMDVLKNLVKEFGWLFSSFIAFNVNKYINECTWGASTIRFSHA